MGKRSTVVAKAQFLAKAPFLLSLNVCIDAREQGVDKEDLANEIRRRIGYIWPLWHANGVVLIL